MNQFNIKWYELSGRTLPSIFHLFQLVLQEFYVSQFALYTFKIQRFTINK
jgi:hypothetical protein